MKRQASGSTVLHFDFRRESAGKHVSGRLREFNRQAELFRGLCLELAEELGGFGFDLGAVENIILARRVCLHAMVDETLIADIEQATDANRLAFKERGIRHG